MQEIIVNHQDRMKEVAEMALFEIKQKKHTGAVVLGLYGDLGAGKTTFVKALGDALGVPEVITSPTFLLFKAYDTNDDRFQTLIHIDAYRLEDPKELIHLEWGELISKPKTLICVEWADKVESILPLHTLRLHFSHKGEHERVITFD